MDLYEAVARRRDVRAEFSGEPLDDAVLERVLGAAHRAPSVGMSQPWDFVLVRDPGTLGAFAQHVAGEREAYAADLPPDRAATFAAIKVEGVREAGLGVVVTHDQSRGGPQVLGRRTIADTGLYSTCLAIQNLWLAATAEGVGVGWVSFFREEWLAERLALPPGVRPVAWLCVGPVTGLQEVPDLERHRWRSRRPLADAVHHETYRRTPAESRS
ncbi:5,6-dimethylbenzimidazole synthase [Nocardioides aquaticus]|uniref:5,6-dimethylbenzimidazole synthase n=1 Tax=Nocardioides aquaticus TaxID=160826 RepID=A0ABX8ECF8_9ACTN|nr:5,6-dimethylbenzimidazole synthase [Nocardioides aquaticus]QVT77906.1 5,6-dimethylbenzimidazole synthase [Nocardioides aquaticus]